MGKTKYIIKHNNGRYVSKDYVVGSFKRAAQFDSEAEARKFISDDGADKTWEKNYKIVKLEECKEVMKESSNNSNKFSLNDWEYNDWPDWEDEDEVKTCEQCGTRLNDGGTCPKCDDGEEDMSDDEFLEAFGEAIKKNHEHKTYKANNKSLKESEENIEDVQELDLGAQVKDALDSIIPEDNEDFDIHELIDAVLAYFDEDGIEYIKSVICPEADE